MQLLYFGLDNFHSHLKPIAMFKNLLLVIFGIFTLIAIMNYWGAIHWLDHSPEHLPADSHVSLSRLANCSCDDTGRYDTTEAYGGGKQVTKDSAEHYIFNFQSSYSG